MILEKRDEAWVDVVDKLHWMPQSIPQRAADPAPPEAVATSPPAQPQSSAGGIAAASLPKPYCTANCSATPSAPSGGSSGRSAAARPAATSLLFLGLYDGHGGARAADFCRDRLADYVRDAATRRAADFDDRLEDVRSRVVQIPRRAYR